MTETNNYEISYILENKEGITWFFYLSENKHIMYTIAEPEGWSEHKTVDSQPIIKYSLTIDPDNIIRIVAYTFSRQLIYYEWNGSKWSQHVLERLYSRFQNVPYLSIHSSSSGTHILYYIDNSLRKSAEFLFHYYLHNDKWHGGRVWKFVSDQITIPLKASLNTTNQLHLFFVQQKQQTFQLYYSIFHEANFSWTNPTMIHSSRQNYDQLHLHIDSDKNIHLVRQEKDGEYYGLVYMNQISEDSQIGWTEKLLHKSLHKMNTPLLMKDKELCCYWQENNILHIITSKDGGVTWGMAEPFSPVLNKPNTPFHFISLRGAQTPSIMDLWGHAYPEIKLLGINWIPDSLNALSDNHSIPVATNQQTKYFLAPLQESVSTFRKDIKEMKFNIANQASQIDHMHSAIYELQEQLRLKDKSLFQIQAYVKQLSFEVNQLRQRSKSMNIGTRIDPPPYQQPIEDKGIQVEAIEIEEIAQMEATAEGIHETTSTEKISLGNVTVLINPEDEEDD